MADGTLNSSPKQVISNANKMTNYSLRCINCGHNEEINLIAHRNQDGYICGFIAVCGNCSRLIEKSERSIRMVIEPQPSGGVEMTKTMAQPKE